MAQTVTVSIKDDGEEDPTVYELAERKPDGPISREDLYKLHLKEAWDQHRYFGGLRAVVTWTPLVIVMLALDRLPWGEVIWPTKAYDIWLPMQYWMVAGVGVLTFIVQYWLQVLQRRAYWQASEAQAQLLKADNRDPVVSYGTMLKAVKNNRKTPYEGYTIAKVREAPLKPDPATLALFAFLAVVMIALYETREVVTDQTADTCTACEDFEPADNDAG